MNDVSYTPVIWVLGIMSIFVTIVVDLIKTVWRKDRHKAADSRRNFLVYLSSIVIGIGVASALRASVFEILKNPENPALFLGWSNESDGAELLWVSEQSWGILITGFILGFLSRAWSDLFKILNEVKYWIRSHVRSE